jgi:beta-glucosidase
MQTPVPNSNTKVTKPIPAVADHAANKLLDPEALLLQLSSEEKIRLLSGDDMWHTAPVVRLGIPRVRVSDITWLGSQL